jgi:hypothetical protein
MSASSSEGKADAAPHPTRSASLDSADDQYLDAASYDVEPLMKGQWEGVDQRRLSALISSQVAEFRNS